MEHANLKMITTEIPFQKRKNLQERLLGLILDSDRVGLMPINLAKNLLRLYQEDQLHSAPGLELTLEAALIIEREKSMQLFSEDIALSKVSSALKNLIGES
jgi:hypothetical protein